MVASAREEKKAGRERGHCVVPRGQHRTCGHDLLHLLANSADLAALCVARLADLVRPPLGEGNAKQAKDVAVGRLNVDARLNEGLPLPDERRELVAGHIHAVEARQQGLALHLLANKLDLAVVQVLRRVQVGQGNLEDTALQRVRSDLCAE